MSLRLRKFLSLLRDFIISVDFECICPSDNHMIVLVYSVNVVNGIIVVTPQKHSAWVVVVKMPRTHQQKMKI